MPKKRDPNLPPPTAVLRCKGCGRVGPVQSTLAHQRHRSNPQCLDSGWDILGDLAAGYGSEFQQSVLDAAPPPGHEVGLDQPPDELPLLAPDGTSPGTFGATWEGLPGSLPWPDVNAAPPAGVAPEVVRQTTAAPQNGHQPVMGRAMMPPPVKPEAFAPPPPPVAALGVRLSAKTLAYIDFLRQEGIADPLDVMIDTIVDEYMGMLGPVVCDGCGAAMRCSQCGGATFTNLGWRLAVVPKELVTSS